MTESKTIESLTEGAHEPDSAMCVMEAVAWIAGDEWSDHPACVSKTIGTFMRSWNDNLPTDADRVRLLWPLVPEIMGTAGDKAIEDRRSWMALDWLVREHVPAWMELTEALKPHAKALRALSELRAETWPAAESVWDAAWAAAVAAARDAAWAAATAAAGAARAPTVMKLQASAQDLVRRMATLHRVEYAPKRELVIAKAARIR